MRSYVPLTQANPTRFTPDQTEIVSTVNSSSAVVTLPDVKEFLPVNHDDYDATITRLIDSVTRQVESYIRQDLIKKNIKSYWAKVPREAILSRGPHDSIEKVTVIDSNGEERELTEGVGYEVKGMKWKRLYEFTEYGQLFVEYTSGYDTAKRPPEVAGAILQEISLQFKNRQDPDAPAMTSVNSLSLEARHLLASLRRISF